MWARQAARALVGPVRSAGRPAPARALCAASTGAGTPPPPATDAAAEATDGAAPGADSLDIALANVRTAMQQAFENNDPDDILRAKQLASTFIEKYSESVKLLDDARRRHVNSIYGEQVEQLKVDLIRLFRLRSFDG